MSSMNLIHLIDAIRNDTVGPEILKIRGILRYQIIWCLTDDLTDGRKNKNLIPYTSEEVAIFIKTHDDNIEGTITKTIEEYSHMLDELEDPIFGFFQKDLYERINMKKYMSSPDDERVVEYEPNYENKIRGKIHLIIKNDLTIGRSDNDLTPFTIAEIDKFIKDNENNIEETIIDIIQDYVNYGDELELSQLSDSDTLDWITEYLYDFVDTKQHMFKEEEEEKKENLLSYMA